jgi:hypothetical protein
VESRQLGMKFVVERIVNNANTERLTGSVDLWASMQQGFEPSGLQNCARRYT